MQSTQTLLTLERHTAHVRMTVTMLATIHVIPRTSPTMTPTEIPVGNTNSKEKVKQHTYAILFIDLGRLFV